MTKVGAATQKHHNVRGHQCSRDDPILSGMLPSWPAVQGTDTDVSAEHVVNAAEAGDTVALRIIESAGTYAGIGLSAVASAFDPQVIVVGGGVMSSGGIVLQRARKEFLERTISPLGSLVPIVPAALGEKSSLWGAAALVSSMRR